MTFNKDTGLHLFSCNATIRSHMTSKKYTCRLLLICYKEPLLDPPQETMSIAFISYMNYGTFSAELM